MKYVIDENLRKLFKLECKSMQRLSCKASFYFSLRFQRGLGVLPKGMVVEVREKNNHQEQWLTCKIGKNVY